jgi:hypothetical protein
VFVPRNDPSLLGGTGGPDVAFTGDVGQARGQTIDLPDSPIELGAIRPYQSVYPEYETSARQSLARQELPPALESLVQRYFSAIAPDEGAKP